MGMDVVVVGSLVVDMPVWLDRAPAMGETQIARRGGLYPGGKGLNQAVQAARLGAQVLLVGAVGRDPLGDILYDAVTAELGEPGGVVRLDGATTSYAVPVISPQGQYIVQVAGANRALSASHVRRSGKWWQEAKILLVQGEVPADASLAAMRDMRQRGGAVVLDPAPAEAMTPALLSEATALTPNRIEFSQLTGDAPLASGCRALFSRYSQLDHIVVTRGDEGVFWAQRDGHQEALAACAIEVQDPTAAGDAFNGALAYALSQQGTWAEAVAWGIRAGAVAAAQFGALPSLGRREQLERLVTLSEERGSTRDIDRPHQP